ncbi:MAG: DUF296 domain-containing protein [Candidatus Diapherotrites archaeon]|nr:DUF296 domain-containing protein [Candidatus Diapherotrites archaeon]
MQELVEVKVNDNENVMQAVQKVMTEKDIRLFVPVEASGSIKNFAISVIGKTCSLQRDMTGRSYEIGSMSGKIHALTDGFLWDLSIIVRGNGTGPVHGTLKDAVAAGPVSLTFRKVNMAQIRIA